MGSRVASLSLIASIVVIVRAEPGATDPTPIVTVKDHECKERGSGYLPPQQASSLNSVAKWAESACDSKTFSWSEVNWDMGGAFCCKTRDDSGTTNPTWNIYQLAGSKLEIS